MTEPGESREEALRRAASVASFVQGEVLEVPDVCVVVVDPAWPLDDSSAAMATSEGGDLAVVPAPSESVVLLTQTCDLQRTTPESRFCQVAPVTNGSPAFARQVHRGYWPGWVDLPWHWPTSVADLSQITTVERSVLVGVASRGRPGTPAERAHFAEMVGRHFSRAALPDAVSAALRPFVDRIKKKYDKASAEGRCLALIGSLRVEAAPDLDADAPDLRILVILPTEELSSLPVGYELNQANIDQLTVAGVHAAATAAGSTDPVARREAWTALAELWLQPAIEKSGGLVGVGDLDIEVLNDEELTFARSRNAPELDLAYLTSRAA